jgi:diadenosine tetraphosphate (Ap4A) HIT family hydrolase
MPQRYTDFIKEKGNCPFCAPAPERILASDEYSYLTYALAPYHEHHLLVIPKRHTEDFEDQTAEELTSINAHLRQAVAFLKKRGYSDYTILLRTGARTGQSVPHQHYHAIPAVVISNLTYNNDERLVMTDEQIARLVTQFRESHP